MGPGCLGVPDPDADLVATRQATAISHRRGDRMPALGQRRADASTSTQYAVAVRTPNQIRAQVTIFAVIHRAGESHGYTFDYRHAVRRDRDRHARQSIRRTG